ncbi:hypothetical protein RHMOL_Rhmol05G0042000 [Rhododendron molle]|uniref:Uncharacterized protein n=1 Tax=Rhododendron molle TaxID=49168 RepID=A0ACC0NKN3_RHOML|nr:hypothetical protein RHMOL_Rhmol05G0042000 [Rhododendron molle]
MVLHVPFLRWDGVGNPLTSSSGTAFYYLETAGGEQVTTALALRTESNRLIYRASSEFLEEYQELLHLGTILEWDYVFQLNAWLDDIVYHSFVRHGTAGVPSFWYFKTLCMPTVVEFKHKLILGCERKWIFHAVMFDARGYEFVFGWSRPNGRWHDIHPPLGNAHTAFLPSALMAYHTVLKFLCFNVRGPDLLSEFEDHLKDVFKMLSLEQIVLRMGNLTWTIQIRNYKLNVQQFREFAAALHVQFLNHVMVTMLPTVEFVVIVYYDSERVYGWCLANANKIRQLPPLATMQPLMLQSQTSSSADPVKIEPLGSEILEKLAQEKEGTITLKAYMYTYAGISQLRFNVHSMCPTAHPKEITSSSSTLTLPPPTPTKRDNPGNTSPSEASPETPATKKLKGKITTAS